MTFSSWVRATRLAANQRAEDCAQRAGITQSAWSQFEHRAGRPGYGTVEKISRGLGVPLDEALQQAYGVSRDDDEAERDLARRIGPRLRRLAPEKRRRIVDALDQVAEAMICNAT